MKRVRGIGERRRHVTATFRNVEVRMKDRLCSVLHCPPHRFRITPAFMTDGDAKRKRAYSKNVTPRARNLRTLLRWVELHFVLETRNAAVGVDDQRGDPQSTINLAFRTQNHCDRSFLGGSRNFRPRLFHKLCVWWWHLPT